MYYSLLNGRGADLEKIQPMSITLQICQVHHHKDKIKHSKATINNWNYIEQNWLFLFQLGAGEP